MRSLQMSFVLVLVVLNTSVFTAPNFPLGESGLPIWAQGDAELYGVYPFDDGNAIGFVWETATMHSISREIVFQIIDSDGRPVFENPETVSKDNWILVRGMSAQDIVGQIFVTWTSLSPESDRIRLYTQRIDIDGNFEWGDNGTLVDDRLIDMEDPEIDLLFFCPYIVPDDRGGIYIEYNDRIIAVDENGDSRNWRWEDQDFREDRFVVSTPSNFVTDGDGGFWYRVVYGQVPNWRMNHIDYNGNRLWDAPQLPGHPIQLSASGSLNLLPGVDGGVIFECSVGHVVEEPDSNDIRIEYNQGIAITDDEGVIADDRLFVYGRDDDYDEESVLEWMHPTSDGSLLFPVRYYDLRNGAHTNDHFYLSKYDPVNNEFPMEQDGIYIDRLRAGEIQRYFKDAVELSEGNLVAAFTIDYENPAISNKLKLYVIDPEERQVSRSADWSEFSLNQLISTPENTFWGFGIDQQKSGQLSDQVYYLNRFDEELDEQFPDGINTGMNNNGRILNPNMWKDNEGTIHLLFADSYNGLTFISMTEEGEFIGNPNGELIRETSGNKICNAKSLKLANGNIAVVYAEKEQTRLASYDTLQVYLFNDRMEAVWSFGAEVNLWAHDNFTITESPFSNHLAVTVIHSDAEDKTTEIMLIDSDDGDVIWSRSVPFATFEDDDNAPDFWQGVIFSGDAIFYGSTFRLQNFFLHKFDLEGNRLWDEPYEIVDPNTNLVHDRVFGMTLDMMTDAICIARWRSNRIDNDMRLWVWIEKIDLNNHAQTDSLSFFEQSISGPGFPDFQLVVQNEILWLFSGDNNNFSYQIMTIDGEYMIDGVGVLLDPQVACRPFYGAADPSGGMWMYWNQVSYTESACRVTYFTEEGDLVEGWDEAGVEVFTNVPAPNYPYVALSPDENEFFIIASLNRVNDMNNDPVVFTMQYISNEEGGAVYEEAALAPFIFKIMDSYPNPFNNRTEINFSLTRAANISMAIYDINGRKVMSSDKSRFEVGIHSLSVDAAELATGVYFAKIDAEGIVQQAKLVVLK